MSYKSKKNIFILCLLLLIVVITVLLIHSHIKYQQTYDNSVDIILSPHFDDAVLSLGGLMAQGQHPTIVATFFTESPEVATSTQWDKESGFSNSTQAQTARTKENTDALKMFKVTEKNYDYPDNQYGRTESDLTMQSEVSQDIQALLASYQGKEINIYGPSYFNDSINHPDHILLHKAYLDVARDYPSTSVHFYLYEDYPYTGRFMKESVMSLQKNLENETGFFFDKIEIPLTAADVSKKIDGLEKYSSQIKAFNALGVNLISDTQNFTNTRCGINPDKACEVVYRIRQ